jgi:hypothetical protein
VVQIGLIVTTMSQTSLNVWPELILTSQVDITQNINLNNPEGTTYQSMETTDLYVSRLTMKGKL